MPPKPWYTNGGVKALALVISCVFAAGISYSELSSLKREVRSMHRIITRIAIKSAIDISDLEVG